MQQLRNQFVHRCGSLIQHFHEYGGQGLTSIRRFTTTTQPTGSLKWKKVLSCNSIHLIVHCAIVISIPRSHSYSFITRRSARERKSWYQRGKRQLSFFFSFSRGAILQIAICIMYTVRFRTNCTRRVQRNSY